MNKLIFWGTLMLSVALVVCAFGQEDMRVVDNSVFDHPQRPPSLFNHDTHNENAGLDDCAECHHLYDDSGKKLEAESSEDQMCADCHTLQDDGRKPGLRKAFHTNCKGCHLIQEKGPVVCAQCHLR
jgi:hypothetical protein